MIKEFIYLGPLQFPSIMFYSVLCNFLKYSLLELFQLHQTFIKNWIMEGKEEIAHQPVLTCENDSFFLNT